MNRDDLTTAEEIATRSIVDYKNYCIDKLLIDQTMMQDTAHRLQMKIFDIEGREELVTTELEHQIELRDAVIKELEALVGNKDFRIADLESQRRIVRKARDGREDEMLQMVESRDRMIHHAVQQNNASMATLSDMNDAMIEMYGLVQDWYVPSPNATIMSTTNATMLKLHKLFCIASANKLFGDDMTIKIDNDHVDTTFDPDEVGRHAANLESLDLLGDILKIVNTTIHQKMRSPYHKNDAFDGDRMREVCDTVTDFRKAHNIVG